MKQLRVLSLSDALEWDSIVESFSNYDVYYLRGYVKAFQLHGDGEPLLFYYQGDDGLRGINVVMKRDIALDPHFVGVLPEGQYFDFATPYGYGGWLLEGDGDPAPLFAAYEDWCLTNRIISEFVRFHPVLVQNKGILEYFHAEFARYTLGTNLALYDDPVAAEFSKSCRKNIRRAIQRGVTWSILENPQHLDEFTKVYYETMDRNNASNYYYFKKDYFHELATTLRHNILLIKVEFEGATISSGIYMACNKYVHAHLTGTYTDSLSYYPAYIMEYGMTLWGKAHGYQLFHHGGGRSNAPNDSLYLFKKQFAHNTEFEFYLGKKIWLPDIYNYLVQMRSLDNDSSFFPRYRA